jgi:predicted outer membrane repeat protein
MITATRACSIACIAGAILLSGCADPSANASAGGFATSSKRIHVSASAPAGGTGAQWSDASSDLHAALALAEPGDEIWVAEGTYRPAPPGGDRLASFAMKSGVALYGGFSGGETQLAQRDVIAHPTILSGDLDGDDGADFANTEENSIHVVVAIGVDERALLDGFTVQSGRADGPGFGATPDSQDQGAGINIFGGAPVIRNCMIARNWVSNHGAVNDHGDASTFVDTMWCNNYSDELGGGLYVHHHSMTTVLGCTFVYNEAKNDGGGTYCRSEHGASFRDCAWVGNRATSGAGMFHAETSAAHVADSTFTANEAGHGGGGMFCERSTTLVEGCLFEDNSAAVDVTTGGGGGGGSGGGGFWSTGGATLVAGCVFRRNVASFGAGVYHIDGSAGQVVDCDFEDNRAGEGAGSYSLSSPTRTSGCRFVDNVASGTIFSVGGGASSYFSDAVVEDCLFRGNRAELGGGAMYCEGEDPLIVGSRFEGNEAFGAMQGLGGALLNGYHVRSTVVSCTFALNRGRHGGAIHDMFSSEARVVNCSFAGNSAQKGGSVFAHELCASSYANCVMWGSTPNDHFGPIQFAYGCMTAVVPGAVGSISVDPSFTRMPSVGADLAWGTGDDDFGDLRLLPRSPCIDAGANRAVPAGVTWDVDGAARFHDAAWMPDTGLGASPVVDMGACEAH